MSYQSVNVVTHLNTLIALSNVSGRRNTGLQMQQEKWRSHLQREVLLQATSIKSIVTAGKQNAEHQAKKQDECCNCGELRFPQDMVRFECPAPRRRRGEDTSTVEPPKHDFCLSCVHQFVKQQQRTQAHELGCPDSERVHRNLQIRRPEMHILVCPCCHVPVVVEQSAKFNESLERDDLESRLQYSVHLAATRLLRDNYCTDEVQENQRRSFFGAFSGQNLLVLDLCGEFSDPKAGFCEIEAEDFHSRFQRPNVSWIWLENWTPKEWIYGERNFEDLFQKIVDPKFDANQHQDVSGVTCLVRTRRQMRTRIRMNDDLKDDFLQV
jgi:hypothetical protein